MGETTVNRSLLAFRRLLQEGVQGGQAKVDALVALSQRTVFVAAWTEGGDDFRTLINSNGQNALPLFTDKAQLMEASRKLGWLGPDGTVPHREIGARGAFRYLASHDLGFLIIDIAAEHSLEAERNEIEPLLTATKRQSTPGPFAAVGRISETMLQAVKAAPRPPAVVVVEPPTGLPPGALDTSSGSASAPVAAAPVAAAPVAASPMTFGSGAGSVVIQPLGEPPTDELLDALGKVLRGFPEVEWASFFLASRGPTDARPTVGLRVDTSYRERLPDIINGLRECGDAMGASIDTMLLDDPAVVRAARSEAVVFFPFRRRR